MASNYTLGRGKVSFSRFKPGTTVPAGFYYIGNTPEFSMTIETQMLDHYSSDEGIREKDESVPLEVNRTGSLTTDNISPENVALFFFGENSIVSQTTVAAAPETLSDIKAGHTYKLGVTPARPAGYFGLNATGLTVEVGVTDCVVNVDYTIDLNTGMITFLPGSLVAVEGADVVVTYAVKGSTRSRVISGSESIEGAMNYVSKNPKGEDVVIYIPYLRIMPNGDYNLKGDDWQMIPLSLEILKLDGVEAIYRDGLPAYS